MNATSPRIAIDIRAADPSGLIELRRAVTKAAKQVGLGLTEQTKLLTAASELARNIMEHAGSGSAAIDVLYDPARSGVRLTFTDQGPGIADVDLAMQDGYTSGRGMGLGLPGAKRLVHDFSITTAPGQGTSVVIVIWKR